MALTQKRQSYVAESRVDQNTVWQPYSCCVRVQKFQRGSHPAPFGFVPIAEKLRCVLWCLFPQTGQLASHFSQIVSNLPLRVHKGYVEARHGVCEMAAEPCQIHGTNSANHLQLDLVSATKLLPAPEIFYE